MMEPWIIDAATELDQANLDGCEANAEREIKRISEVIKKHFDGWKDAYDAEVSELVERMDS